MSLVLTSPRRRKPRAAGRWQADCTERSANVAAGTSAGWSGDSPASQGGDKCHRGTGAGLSRCRRCDAGSCRRL